MRVRLIGATLALISLAWLLAFGASLYYVEKLPPWTVAGSAATPLPEPADAEPVVWPRTEDAAPAPTGCASPSWKSAATSQKIFAHLPYWPAWSYISLERNCGLIDAVMPERFAFDANGEITRLDQTLDHQRPVVELIARNRERLEVWPVLRPALGIAHALSAEALSDPIARARFMAEATDLGTGADYEGICLDVTGLPQGALQGLARVLPELDAAFGRNGMESCLIAGAGDRIWDTPGLVDAADKIVVSLFSGGGDTPVPSAPQAWFESAAAEARDRVDPGKLVLALGTYTFAWAEGSAEPEFISYAEALARAAQADAAITLDPLALNTKIDIARGRSGGPETLWLLDAVSAHNQLAALSKAWQGALAVWNLGYEDPGVWPLIASPSLPPADAADRLADVPMDRFVVYQGEGVFRRIALNESRGLRLLEKNTATGLIDRQTYQRMPQPLVVERWGDARAPYVALTFDDGPDTAHTERILDILLERDVPAAFFVLGDMILRHPETLRRIVNEGHEVGSHSFYHPSLDTVSDMRIEFELNAVQRLIASVTGRQTLLFRMPYSRGQEPLIGGEAGPLLKVNEAGYVTVAGDVAPPDWEGISASEIKATTAGAISPERSTVVILHDGGGDRTATIDALPQMIDDFRAQGYEFVSLASLMGTTREAIMPPAGEAVALIDRASFSLMGLGRSLLVAIFWFAIGISLVRSLGYLFVAHLRHSRPAPETPFLPPVTALVPAYNEELVVVDCVRAILASDYPDLRVVVVDDGSTDRTAERLIKAFSKDPRVRILHQANQGKWAALNTAYDTVETEFVVAVDADTMLRPDAIRWLVQPLHDPEVGAVAGLVDVGNRNNLLTLFQTLEYVTTQNVMRRAAEFYDGLLVVPGAIGAWRVAAVRRAGLYSSRTLAEDADLTVSVHRAGYQVMFEERARAVTEVPARVRPFMRQRLRWVLGMVQTGWKHRRVIREGRSVGVISILDFIFIGAFNQLLAPIVDLVFLATLIDAGVDYWLSRPVFSSALPTWIVASYLILPVLDVVLAAAAFRFDPTAPRWLIALVPFQRIFYRQLLYITVYRAVGRALSGQLARWQKPDRLPRAETSGA